MLNILNKTEDSNGLFVPASSNTGYTQTLTSVENRTSSIDRHRFDPSSVMRSERYPVPSFAENRMQVRG